MSSIVVTVLIILISLVAVGIVYSVLKGGLGDSLDNAPGTGQYTLKFDIPLQSVFVNHSTKEVTFLIVRKAGEGDLKGFLIGLDDHLGNSQTNRSYETTVVRELETLRVRFTHSLPGNITQITVAPFIGTSSGSSVLGTPFATIPIGPLGRASGEDTLVSVPGSQFPECNDMIDNDGDLLIDLNDSGCLNINDTSEADIVVYLGCSNGLDDDGDSWIDGADADCSTGTQEEWIALSDCADGIDNDRDGTRDRNDGDCANARDMSEFSSVGACSDGLDNDNDGFIDYPLEPDCASVNGVSEADSYSTSLAIKWGLDGYISELNWTAFSPPRRVVWDEKFGSVLGSGSGRFGFGGVRFYLHSTYNDYGAVAWSYISGNTFIQRTHAQLAYTLTQTNAERARLDVTDGTLVVRDSIRLHGSNMYISVNVTNGGSQHLTNISIPMYLGGLSVGRMDSTGALNMTQSNLSLLQGSKAGYIQRNYNSNGGVETEYPHIGTFSPVSVFWDSNLTIGQQLISKIQLPDSVRLYQKAQLQLTPAFVAKIRTELAPGESKVFVFVFTVVGSGNWQAGLQPYKNAFTYNYGTTPTYCPSSSLAYHVAGNSQVASYSATHRFLPGSTLSGLFNTTQSLPALQAYGVNYVGLWQTTLYSACLIGNGDCTRLSVPECVATGNSANCEFSGNTEYLDPNIAEGLNRSKIANFTTQYNNAGKNIFWYMRPCADNMGINVTYNPNGSIVLHQGGTPTGYSDLDLRNVTNRDRQVRRFVDLAGHGVNGFYMDATGCAGEESFYTHLRRNLTQTYGRDFFLSSEGAIDRVALIQAQMPLVKLGSYTSESSLLLPYLVPDATYYGGLFNSQLNRTEINDIASKGYQIIGMGIESLSYLASSCTNGNNWWEIQCRETYGTNTIRGTNLCSWTQQSYQNQLARWNSYGNALGCPQPQAPPSCPV